MAGTPAKRQKEHARLERRQQKEELKKQRKEEKSSRPPPADGVDPDIAHIVPGPQPQQDS